MICAHCSTPVADEARFCHSCGSLVSDAEGQAAATASMDQSSFLNMERLLREDTKGVYTVQHMLGRGGMAVVYLATEIGLSRKVALKVLPPELTFGHGVERFKREAKTAAALDHPHIIPIYRIGDSGKIFWYAMKYLEGKSLEDIVRERGALPLDETLEILGQVADALDYAHEHHVIHRDIKPANVMLDNRDRVIVTDFGIAKALTEGKLTATDSVIGTPYFMSPEQGMGKTVTGASDQYSVAVMAYRMLAGHVPFDGDSAIDILHKHCMFEAPSLLEDVPEIPEHVSVAVARALSKKGDERFASVREFVKAMKDPSFKAKSIVRPSVATVVMDASDAKKLRAVGGDKAASNPGRGKTQPPKTAPAEDRTVVAAAQPGAAKAKPAAAPAPAPKSKAGLFATIALVVVAGGGIAAWQLIKAPASAVNEPAPSVAAPAPLVASPPAAVDTNATKVAEAVITPPETKAPETKVPETKAATKAPTKAPPATKSAPVTRPAATQTPTQAPVQSAPMQSAPVVTAPEPAPAAASTGTLNLLISPPGLLEIDEKDYDEKSRFRISLPAGTHVIRVRKEGFLTLTETVEVKAGVTEQLRLNLVPRP